MKSITTHDSLYSSMQAAVILCKLYGGIFIFNLTQPLRQKQTMIHQNSDLNYSQTLKKTTVSVRDLTIKKMAKCILNVQDNRRSTIYFSNSTTNHWTKQIIVLSFTSNLLLNSQ